MAEKMKNRHYMNQILLYKVQGSFLLKINTFFMLNLFPTIYLYRKRNLILVIILSRWKFLYELLTMILTCMQNYRVLANIYICK
jgi:hypothetical protein